MNPVSYPGEERRRYKRKEIRIPVRLFGGETYPRVGEDMPLGTTIDVSSGGVFVQLTNPPELESKIKVEFILPADEGPVLTGRVLRSNPYGVAIGFETVQPWLIPALVS